MFRRFRRFSDPLSSMLQDVQKSTDGEGEGQHFEFYCPVVTFEKAGAEDGKQRRVAGIISTESKDLQGEVILQRGLDFDYFLKHGWLNNNHASGMSDVLGYPERVQTYAKGATLPDGSTAKTALTWMEGYLLHTKQADQVWELARALQGTDRRLGYSIEGQIQDREGPNDKTISRALVRNTALTHCFPGWTKASGAASAVSRRWYDGPMVHIVLAGGHKVSATPNHPILTNRGWTPIGELNRLHDKIGHHLDNLSIPARVTENVDHMPATLQEIFNAGLDARGHHDVRTGGIGDFHGDGANRDVDVVLIERELRANLQSTFFEHFGKLALAASDAGLSPLAGYRNAARMIAARLFSFSPLTTAFDALGALLWRPLLDAAQIFLAARPAYASLLGDGVHQFATDAVFRSNLRATHAARVVCDRGSLAQRAEFFPNGSQDAHISANGSDALTRNAVTGSDAGRRLSSNVRFSNIESILVTDFSGHVYNLHTDHGWYGANGIVAHNCPVNTDSRLDILMRSMNASYIHADASNKAFSMGTATSVVSNKPYSGDGAGAVLAPESLEGAPRRKKKRSQDGMSKSEAVAWAMRHVPNLDEKTARQFVHITSAFVRSSIIDP